MRSEKDNPTDPVGEQRVSDECEHDFETNYSEVNVKGIAVGSWACHICAPYLFDDTQSAAAAEEKPWQGSARELKELFRVTPFDGFDSIEAFYLLDHLETEIVRLERLAGPAAAVESFDGNCLMCGKTYGKHYGDFCDEDSEVRTWTTRKRNIPDAAV